MAIPETWMNGLGCFWSLTRGYRIDHAPKTASPIKDVPISGFISNEPQKDDNHDMDM